MKIAKIWILNVGIASLLSIGNISGSYSMELASDKSFFFDLNQAPSKSDWKKFSNSPDKFKNKLWAYHVKQGKDLYNWHWSWRIAWLRFCGKSSERYCLSLLLTGLSDKAAVVRGEAAVRIGIKHSGSSNMAIIKPLIHELTKDHNYRHKKPLVVPEKIVNAIWQISGGNYSLVSDRFNKVKIHRKVRNYIKKVYKIFRDPLTGQGETDSFRFLKR